MQKERGRLQRQMGREPIERIEPRTPGKRYKEAEAKEATPPPTRGAYSTKPQEPLTTPESIKQTETGRQIQHSKFGAVVESPDQTGVRKGQLRVTDGEGNAHIIRNPRIAGNREASFVKKEETAKPAEPPDIAAGISRLARTPTSPVEISKLRQEFPGLSKPDFDAEMAKLNESGKIALLHHDHPASLSESQRESMVKIGDDYFTAVTMREAAPSLENVPRVVVQALKQLNEIDINRARVEATGAEYELKAIDAQRKAGDDKARELIEQAKAQAAKNGWDWNEVVAMARKQEGLDENWHTPEQASEYARIREKVERRRADRAERETRLAEMKPESPIKPKPKINYAIPDEAMPELSRPSRPPLKPKAEVVKAEPAPVKTEPKAETPKAEPKTAAPDTQAADDLIASFRRVAPTKISPEFQEMEGRSYRNDAYKLEQEIRKLEGAKKRTKLGGDKYNELTNKIADLKVKHKAALKEKGEIDAFRQQVAAEEYFERAKTREDKLAALIRIGENRNDFALRDKAKNALNEAIPARAVEIAKEMKAPADAFTGDDARQIFNRATESYWGGFDVDGAIREVFKRRQATIEFDQAKTAAISEIETLTELTDAERKAAIEKVNTASSQEIVRYAVERAKDASEAQIEMRSIAEGVAKGAKIPKPEDVAASVNKQKPDKKTGLTPLQETYLLESLKSKLPQLNRAEGVIIKVPGDGKFTVKDRSQANNLAYRMTGKPLEKGFITTVKPLPSPNMPSLTRTTPKTRGAYPVDAEGVVPIDEYRIGGAGNLSDPTTQKESGWAVATLEDGRAVYSDGHVMALGKPPAKHSTNKSVKASQMNDIWTGSKFKKADEPVAFYTVEDGKIPYVAFKSGQVINAKYFDHIMEAHPNGTWAEYRFKDKPLMARLVNDEPVALLAPLDTKGVKLPEDVQALIKPSTESKGHIMGAGLGSLQGMFERGAKPAPDQTGVAKGFIKVTDASGKTFITEKPKGRFVEPKPPKPPQAPKTPPKPTSGAPASRDVRWYDYLKSPLSNLNYKGTYERIAGQTGKEISDAFKRAQLAIARDEGSRGRQIQELENTLRGYKAQLREDGKPGLANWLDEHVAALHDPDSAFRGLVGFLKKFQYDWKLRHNPRSIVVNELQSLQTLWPHLTTREFLKIAKDARRKETRARLEDLASRESGGKVEEMETEKKKWLPDVFSKVSTTNRIMGHLAGELMADRMGLTGEAKATLAADWAKKVEFDNSRWNVPPLFRGRLASVIGQFKPFMVKNLERLHADWTETPMGSETGKLARRSKMILGQLAIGGARSVLVPGIKEIGGVLILGGLANAFMKSGMEEDTANKAAETLYFGLPGLVEQDLSSSMMLLDSPFGNTPAEKAVNMLGPTASLIFKAWKEGETMATAKDTSQKSRDDKVEESAVRLAKAATPYAKTVESVVSLAGTGKAPKLRLGKDEVERTMPEAIGHALMSTPLRQTKFYEEEDAFDWQKRMLGQPMKPGRLGSFGNALDAELKKHNLDYSRVDEIPGDTEKSHQLRSGKVERWMKQYGGALVQSPRYRILPADQQKAAIETLRRRVGGEANSKQPRMSHLSPHEIIQSVRKSAAGKPERDRKKIIVAPEQ
jgi:hypothetical protein